MSRYIALDIETANLDMEAEGLEFGNPKGWKTSCVCLYAFWIDDRGRDGQRLLMFPILRILSRFRCGHN